MKKTLIKSIALLALFSISSSVGHSSESSTALNDLISGPLLDAKGKEVDKKVLEGKTVGLYFSAHWCPPCRTFTPNLVKFRDSNKKDFEVVFISSDRDSKAQLNYMKETKMKWYTLPHRSEHANALAKKFEVRGIPALIIVSKDGTTITKNGRGDVSSNPKGALDSWQKKS